MALFQIFMGDGKTIEEVDGKLVDLGILSQFQFFIHKGKGQIYWLISEVSSGTRVSIPMRTQKKPFGRQLSAVVELV